MEVAEVSPGLITFLRPDEGSNAGLIRTADVPALVAALKRLHERNIRMMYAQLTRNKESNL